MNKIITHKKTFRQNGFTLVELLFACAILGFMLTITMVTFIGVFRFYNWSKTTRTTQQAARQVMGSMTREIQARRIHSASGTELCLNSITPTLSEKSFKIFLDQTNQQIKTQSYSNENCDTAVGSANAISEVQVNVTKLIFVQVNGAGPDISTSVTINMQVTNGIPEGEPAKCRPTDNFCDQATFTTAVMQR